MISASEMEKGLTLDIEGEPYLPGRPDPRQY